MYERAFKPNGLYTIYLRLEFDPCAKHLKVCLTVEIIAPNPHRHSGAALTSGGKNVLNIRWFSLKKASTCREQHGTPTLHAKVVP